MAFMYAFNGSFPGTDTPAGLNARNIAVDAHAAVGKQVTISAEEPNNPMIDDLVAIARTGAIGLVAHGCVDQRRRGYMLTGPDLFTSLDGSAAQTLSRLRVLSAQQPITFTAVRAGTQQAVGVVPMTDSESLCASAWPPAGTNLMANPNFYSDLVSTGQFRILPAIDGWSSSNGVEVWNRLNGYIGPAGLPTWIELDVYGQQDAIWQTVSTPAGVLLELSFWYSPRPKVSPLSNQFDVLWNGQLLGTLAPDGTGLDSLQWQKVSVRVTATGNDTVMFRESGTNDNYGVLLTGMSLTQVP